MKLRSALSFSFLGAALLVPATSAYADQAGNDPDPVCFSARVTASSPDEGTIIVEDTPVADTLDEASALGLAECERLYADRTCLVVGHSIVDCQ
jgi:hypothetical protein